MLADFYISLQIAPNLTDSINVIVFDTHRFALNSGVSNQDKQEFYMLQNAIISFLLLLFAGVFSFIFGQATAVKPTVVVGDLVTIGDKKLTVNSKTGPVEIVTTDATAYKKVSVENPSLSTATAGVAKDMVVGDRLTVSALPSADGKILTARTVYFLTKAEIDAKNAKEAEAWRFRGITGKVLSVNAQTNQIVMETRTLMGSTNVTVTPKENAKFMRYAPDSVRFDEALASSLAETKAGDMIRALGDKSVDGTSFAAEQIIAGSFQTIAGKVKSVDAEKNEIVIHDEQSKKDLVVVVGEQSILKKFPAEQAEQLARFQMMGAGGGMGGARPVGGGARPQGGPPAGGQPTGQGQPGGQGRPMMGGPRGGAAGGVDDMFDRLPAITAAELKAGDMIAISSTKNGVTTRIKAIKLIAGVEPFLRLAQASSQAGGRRGQGGVDGGFSIPGLDP